MVRTNNEVLYDAINNRSAVLYMEASARDEREPGKVKFANKFYVLREQIIERPTPVSTGFISENVLKIVNGEEVPTGEVRQVEQFQTVLKKFAKPYFFLVYAREAVFNAATFYNKLNVSKPEDLDKALTDQMDFLKSFDWTGREEEKIGLFGLASSDCEILTAEQVAELTKEREL